MSIVFAKYEMTALIKSTEKKGELDKVRFEITGGAFRAIATDRQGIMVVERPTGFDGNMEFEISRHVLAGLAEYYVKNVVVSEGAPPIKMHIIPVDDLYKNRVTGELQFPDFRTKIPEIQGKEVANIDDGRILIEKTPWTVGFHIDSVKIIENVAQHLSKICFYSPGGDKNMVGKIDALLNGVITFICPAFK